MIKTIQCEICGSRDIKKISDDLFECQSCGVQYRKEDVRKLVVEVAGNVSIDRSEEIKNALLRAKQFENDGNTAKAMEYYDRALDLDPENETARAAVDALRSQARERARQAALPTLNVVRATADPKQGVALLLRALKNAPEVAPDLYKDIKVTEVTQGYYPFRAMRNQYENKWQAVSCYRRQVAYTDYREETDWHNKNQDGTYRKRTVPVTRYREEVDRRPTSGSFPLEVFGLFSVGQALNGALTALSPAQYDGAVEKDGGVDSVLHVQVQQNYHNDALLERLEHCVTLLYGELKCEAREVRAERGAQIDGLALFEDEGAWSNRFQPYFSREIGKKAKAQAEKAIPGDFHEGGRVDSLYRGSRSYTFYLPIQRIAYSYRGTTYQALRLLCHEQELFCAYPCCNSVLRITSDAREKEKAVRAKGLPNFCICLYCFALAGPGTWLWMLIKGEDDPTHVGAIVCLVMLLLFGVPAVIWNYFYSRSKRKQLEAITRSGQERVERARKRYSDELEQSAAAFFGVLTDESSVEAACAAANGTGDRAAVNPDSLKNGVWESKLKE